MTTRRAFFGKMAGLFSSIGLISLTACNENTESSSAVIDGNILNAFVDTIVPKDQHAGAVEAGVPGQLLEHFIKKPRAEEKALQMLKVVDEFSRDKLKIPFAECNLKQREMVLEIITKSRNKEYKAARTTILRLRGRIIKAFYNSPAAWEMLAFSAPFPAGYPDFNKPPPV